MTRQVSSSSPAAKGTRTRSGNSASEEASKQTAAAAASGVAPDRTAEEQHRFSQHASSEDDERPLAIDRRVASGNGGEVIDAKGSSVSERRSANGDIDGESPAEGEVKAVVRPHVVDGLAKCTMFGQLPAEEALRSALPRRVATTNAAAGQN